MQGLFVQPFKNITENKTLDNDQRINWKNIGKDRILSENFFNGNDVFQNEWREKMKNKWHKMREEKK